jgi:hypothetical protein
LCTIRYTELFAAQRLNHAAGVGRSEIVRCSDKFGPPSGKAYCLDGASNQLTLPALIDLSRILGKFTCIPYELRYCTVTNSKTPFG